MAKVAVVHTVPPHFDAPVSVGDRFTIVEEPRDFVEALLFMQIAARGDTDRLVVVDLGDSFAVMTREPDDEGLSFHSYFIEDEA